MLDLLIPDLLAPPDAPAAMREVRLPHLERWLVRAERERGSARSALESLASAYALQAPVPVAAVSLAGEAQAPAPAEGAWLRADPVHLRVDRDNVTLHDASVLAVEPAEAREIVASLAALFAPDLEFHVAAPDRWYVRVAKEELPHTTPLDELIGRNVFGLLPRSDGRMRWANALTEAQMLLSTHEVNRAREATGRPPINSVWFWGEGTTPHDVTRPYAEVHAEHVFARGLGRLSGAKLHGLPAKLASLDVPATGASTLVVLPQLEQPLRRNDPEAWLAAARRLDDEWFSHLAQAIERFDRVRLVLPAANGSRIATLTPRSKLRWYRRAKPLAHHA
jgi:hypothetical protein